MSQVDPNRRFQIAHDRARENWALADPRRCAELAGCTYSEDGVAVPFFGGPYRVSHPDGQVVSVETGKPVHAAIAILMLHYLLTADGTGQTERWITFRELPDGLFYAQAFAVHAEKLLAERFGADVASFLKAGPVVGGQPLDLADASFRFQALPRLPIAVLLWEGDDEFPGQIRILFDAGAPHYLPTEDLSGLGDWLAHRLVKSAIIR